ncbi:hypothetical protein D354_02915 [Enterococcus faecalis]|nr:hypothetical protein D924_01972 [Enterococcus faecalis 06-MB-S-10]EPH87856.1 hypothetical protein D923_02246 [Enterococcus faecalis 06-MB-S-04]EPI15008.1 hypothetical protein D354_02915 [Enterococcus faecalis]EPI25279.1 hypothetical protein D351_02906 [Enterococcus faecalis WKS-26-18-2]
MTFEEFQLISEGATFVQLIILKVIKEFACSNLLVSRFLLLL